MGRSAVCRLLTPQPPSCSCFSRSLANNTGLCESNPNFSLNLAEFYGPCQVNVPPLKPPHAAFPYPNGPRPDNPYRPDENNPPNPFESPSPAPSPSPAQPSPSPSPIPRWVDV